MAKKSFINKLLQQTQEPRGFWGRMMLRGMNTGHARLAAWGMEHIGWQAGWTVLDIGCGGGANITEMLKRCSGGKVYGVDASAESVAFARKKNLRMLGSRPPYAHHRPCRQDCGAESREGSRNGHACGTGAASRHLRGDDGTAVTVTLHQPLVSYGFSRSSFRRRLAAFSSSEMVGSLMKRAQGSSGQPPQLRFFFSRQHW